MRAVEEIDVGALIGQKVKVLPARDDRTGRKLPDRHDLNGKIGTVLHGNKYVVRVQMENGSEWPLNLDRVHLLRRTAG